jgi:tetratricopeptide (TPR) repeat protein
MTIPRLVSFILGLLLAAHLVLLGFFPISSEDTWWHLKQGELYVANRSLPAQDPFAFTTAGRQWIHYSWVADIFFYLIFRAAGLPGLILFRLLLLFLIALILYRLLRGCGLHPAASVLFVFLASLALRFRLLVRPEILSVLLLLATMAILLRLRVARPHLAYALLPVQIIWTNVHASFIFGIGLPGLVFLANLLPAGRAEPGWGHLRLDRVHVRHLATATALLPLSSLVNPHGVSTLLFPFLQNRMFRLTMFSEWLEVWRLPGIDPVWWEVVIVLSVVVLAFILTACLLLAWEGSFDPVGWGIVLSLGAYAVFRSRAVPYFVLAVLPLLALALVRAARHLPARGSQGLERAGVLACLLVLGASIWYQAPPTSRFSIGFGLRPDFFPEGAVTFLERHHLDGRIFNSYVFGGYLIWSRWPANQVLIDGRYDTILFDQALLEAYIEAHRSAAALDRITATYAIDILVLNTKPGQGMLFLSQDADWARVYWDPVAEVYVRRGERYADLIAAHEYRLTGPAPDTSYLAAYRRDADTWARALAELRRAVTDNPQNLMAWLTLAQEYRAAGPAALGPRLDALTHAEALMMARAPGLGRLHADRADALLQFGRLDEAKAEAQKALRLQGDLLLARSVLASVAERRRAWAEARDQLQLIMASLAPGDPRVPEIRERLANVERGLQGNGGR